MAPRQRRGEHGAAAREDDRILRPSRRSPSNPWSRSFAVVVPGVAALVLLLAPAARAEGDAGSKALPPPVVRTLTGQAGGGAGAKPAPPGPGAPVVAPPRPAPASVGTAPSTVPAARPVAAPAPRGPAPPAPPAPAAAPGPAPPVPFPPPPPATPAAASPPPVAPAGAVPPSAAATRPGAPGTSAPAGAAGVNGAEPVVVRIVFEGTALFAGQSLQVLLKTEEGRRLDPVRLDEDIQTLYRYFESVRVTEETVPGGVVLHFFVKESPLVVELNIYGAEAIDASEIRDMMSTKVGFPLLPYALAADAEDIVAAYKMRGYYFAQVPEPVITELPGGGRRVDFTIVEGPEVKVQQIAFRGNAHVARKTLLDVMQTHAQGPIPFFSSATFRMETLLEDLVALKRRYEAAGYLDAEVVLEDLRVSDDKARVAITISIVEHQRYLVGDVGVVIERVSPGEPGSPPPEDVQWFTEDRIRCWLGLVPGQPYDGLVEEKGIQKIREEYFRRSYIDASVDPPERRGREHQNVVDLVLTVSEKEKSRLRHLDFVGNEYTRDKILRREARVLPGGYIDRRELDRTLARLQGLGYFDRVTMQIEEVRDPAGEVRPAWKDVRYEVVEGSTGKLNFGVGVSTDGGVVGSVSFSKRNFDITRWPRSFSELLTRRAFTGAGQRLDIFIAPGTVESQFQVAFEEPRLFGSHLSLGVQVYDRITYWENWTSDRLGYGVSLGYPLYEDLEDHRVLSARLTWQHQDVGVRDVNPGAVPGAFLFQGHDELRALSGELSLRTTDDLVLPKHTTTTTLQGELAGGVLGGEVDFDKIGFVHEHWFVLATDEEGKRQTLTLRGELGWAHAFGDTPEVPPYERFYLGGSRLRGFAYRGVGPHIGGRPTGGEWMMLASAEYLYPIVKDTLGVVGFLDTGTLATNIDSSDSGLWRASIGFGMRLRIPVLGPTPLALDFGFPLVSQHGDERSLISFSVGRDF